MCGSVAAAGDRSVRSENKAAKLSALLSVVRTQNRRNSWRREKGMTTNPFPKKRDGVGIQNDDWSEEHMGLCRTGSIPIWIHGPSRVRGGDPVEFLCNPNFFFTYGEQFDSLHSSSHFSL